MPLHVYGCLHAIKSGIKDCCALQRVAMAASAARPASWLGTPELLQRVAVTFLFLGLTAWHELCASAVPGHATLSLII